MGFLALMGLASATSVLDNQEGQNQARTVFTSGGTYYLALNTTYLIYYGILAGLGLLGLLALTSLGGGATESYGGQGQGQYGHSRSDEFTEEQILHQRQRRYANDVASKMAQLEQAFKKYQVEEAECEMYIACEASQVHRIEENGPLAKIVHDILSSFNRAKDSNKWDERMEGLVQAFEYGTGAHQNGQTDPCKPLRTKCFELHSKKNY